MPRIAIKRIYEPAADEDGCRVLVDRLWPRGVSRQAAAIEYWARDIAPSTELRQWFGHAPARWREFSKRYREELERRPGELRALLDACGGRRLTLLYSAKDTQHNQAVVLAAVLEEMLSPGGAPPAAANTDA